MQGAFYATSLYRLSLILAQNLAGGVNPPLRVFGLDAGLE